VEADDEPEKLMHRFKAKASERLNALACDEPGRKRWARHGSTRWLWKYEDVRRAIRYVIQDQGEPMAIFLANPL
jgi:hypothetical protein